MKSNLETLEKVIEAMPIYGELRQLNKQLTFGQYLTVLKGWFDSLRAERDAVEKELRIMLTWSYPTKESLKIGTKIIKEVIGK